MEMGGAIILAVAGEWALRRGWLPSEGHLRGPICAVALAATSVRRPGNPQWPITAERGACAVTTRGGRRRGEGRETEGGRKGPRMSK
ncbi:unnamed protein product [Arctogadus glacialis]